MMKRRCLVAGWMSLVSAVAVGADPKIKPLPVEVNYTEHIAPIVYNNCTECHRDGEGAPFALTNYKQVKKKAKTINLAVEDRFMPPWHPAEGWGHFKGTRRLADRDIALIDKWVETGLKQGDPAKDPKMPKFPDGWNLGTPDMIIKTSVPYTVRAGGADIYRNFVIPLNLKEDKWVTAVEIRPGARTVVHHCLFFLDSTGGARKLDARERAPGFRAMGFQRTGSLGGWAVGGMPRHLPNGLAMSLKKGSDLILAMHFHPSGKEEKEITTIGLFFADKPPAKTLMSLQLPAAYGRRAGLRIPAGSENFKISGSFRVPVDVELVSVGGHAHYLCKTLTSVAKQPNGDVQKLFRIGDWDFNWQNRYFYDKVVSIPAGTLLAGEVTYDNSATNPNNQFDPPRAIRWGPQSTDEMGSVIFALTAAKEKDAGKLWKAIQSHEWGQAAGWVAQLIKNLDRNGDGKISANEIPARFKKQVLRYDKNGDGIIDEKELEFIGVPF